MNFVNVEVVEGVDGGIKYPILINLDSFAQIVPRQKGGCEIRSLGSPNVVFNVSNDFSYFQNITSGVQQKKRVVGPVTDSLARSNPTAPIPVANSLVTDEDAEANEPAEPQTPAVVKNKGGRPTNASRMMNTTGSLG